jgi:hypothetical protein
MSTRAVYTFSDSDGTYHVYKHSDGYPTGAAQAIEATLECAWTLPRFEADEFAAAFVAANKCYWRNMEFEFYRNNQDLEANTTRANYSKYDGGGVRLMRSGSIRTVAPCDIEYRYSISVGSRPHGEPQDMLKVVAYSTDYHGETKKEEKIFTGSLREFKAWAEKEETAAA